MSPTDPSGRTRQHFPFWLKRADDEVGVAEYPGPSHNERILEYHAKTGLGATDDETPWCSSFCCWVLEKEGFTSTRSAAALSWLRWGRVIEEPRLGCIVVFERRDANGVVIPNRGHVGFWMGEDGPDVLVLGGNQSNKVGINRLPKSRVIGYRWPSSPTNSTTNIASVMTGVGTAVASAPSVLEVMSNVSKDASGLSGAVESSRSIVERFTDHPSAIAVASGLLLALLSLIYIVRERNKKIRELGV